MLNLIGNGISKVADFAGYIPLVSTITGLTRVIYGYAVVKFNEYRASCAVKDERPYEVYREKVEIGKSHIELGKIEAIPFYKFLFAFAIKLGSASVGCCR